MNTLLRHSNFLENDGAGLPPVEELNTQLNQGVPRSNEDLASMHGERVRPEHVASWVKGLVEVLPVDSRPAISGDMLPPSIGRSAATNEGTPQLEDDGASGPINFAKGKLDASDVETPIAAVSVDRPSDGKSDEVPSVLSFGPEGKASLSGEAKAALDPAQAQKDIVAEYEAAVEEAASKPDSQKTAEDKFMAGEMGLATYMKDHYQDEVDREVAKVHAAQVAQAQRAHLERMDREVMAEKARAEADKVREIAVAKKAKKTKGRNRSSHSRSGNTQHRLRAA